MEDDLIFGTSVWATSEPISSQDVMKSQLVPSSILDDAQPAFSEEFDDFGTPTEVLQADLNNNDDFGDFGDFGEGPTNSSAISTEQVTFDDFRISSKLTQHWSQLILDPFPSHSSLKCQIDDILGPLWNYEDIADVTTDEPIREAEGVSQILITQSRCGFRVFTHIIYRDFPRKSRNVQKSTPNPTSDKASKLDSCSYSTTTPDCSWYTYQS